jgi:integrase
MPIRVYVRQKSDRKDLLLYYKDPLTGKEKSKSAGTSERKAAERAAQRWEAELDEFHGDGSGWDFFVERFRDEHLAFKAPNTRGAYMTALNHFAAKVKVTNLSEINTGTMSLFASQLLKENRPQASIKSYLTHVRAALSWAERVGMIKKVPHISIPSTGSRGHMRGRPLTAREFAKMLKACRQRDNARAWRDLLKLLWYSGLRLGEALSLSWDTPPLVVHLDAKPYPLIVIDAEGQKSRTDTAAPMAPDLYAWLSRVPPEQRHGYVVQVVNAVGKRYNTEKLSEEVSNIGKAAGVKVTGNDGKQRHATAHDLRRTFATRWAAKVRPLTLQRMMRHSDLSTTLKFYVGLTSADVGAELWIGKGKDP